jgi:hypothetical protein
MYSSGMASYALAAAAAAAAFMHVWLSPACSSSLYRKTMQLQASFP